MDLVGVLLLLLEFVNYLLEMPISCIESLIFF
jgi:hypothetical protein